MQWLNTNNRNTILHTRIVGFENSVDFPKNLSPNKKCKMCFKKILSVKEIDLSI